MAFIRQTLKNFYRLGLVNKENGTLTPKYKFISTNNEYSKIENVNFHTQALNEASTMLSNLNNEQRSYGSLTILLDKNEVGEIRKDIQSFGESLLSKYSEKNRDLNKENLVRVNMQLYLLSKEGDENEK